MRQIDPLVGDVMFYFLCEDDKGISGYFVGDVKKRRWMWDIVDDVKLTKLYPWAEVTGGRVQI